VRGTGILIQEREEQFYLDWRESKLYTGHEGEEQIYWD